MMDVLGITIFNHDFRRLDGSLDKYYKSYLNSSFIWKPWLRLLLSLPWAEKIPIKAVQDHFHDLEILVGFFKEMIKENKENRNNSIISKLIDSPDALTERELLSNIWVFFIAGHDSTSNALVWELNSLRAYPDIQEKVYQEIIRVIGADRAPVESDLDKLEYMTAFINEVFRRHTSVPYIRTRVATKDVKYKDMIIPKGSKVGINFHILHTNPLYWDDPLKFDPERFSAENRRNRNRFLHIPFSAGLRQCIGNKLSMKEQKLFLTRLLQKYRIVDPKENKPFPEDSVLSMGISLPVHVRFEKRNYPNII
jgi:cytochrome P450